MTKWKAVIIGFILSVMVESFFARYDFVGLLIVGFITGYIAHNGALSGMWNAALAGALGTVISAVLFILATTIGGSFLGLFGGMVGFTTSGLISLIAVVEELIYYAIVMGITGAIGGAVANRK